MAIWLALSHVRSGASAFPIIICDATRIFAASCSSEHVWHSQPVCIASRPISVHVQAHAVVGTWAVQLQLAVGCCGRAFLVLVGKQFAPVVAINMRSGLLSRCSGSQHVVGRGLVKYAVLLRLAIWLEQFHAVVVHMWLPSAGIAAWCP
jgi:hypothetical protein